jgi:hypothetical protein
MLHNMRAPPVAWRYALLNLCPLWRGSIHAGLHRAVYATVHVESQREQVERVSLELAGHDGGLRRGACEEGPAKRGLRRGACEEGPAENSASKRSDICARALRGTDICSWFSHSRPAGTQGTD